LQFIKDTKKTVQKAEHFGRSSLYFTSQIAGRVRRDLRGVQQMQQLNHGGCRKQGSLLAKPLVFYLESHGAQLASFEMQFFAILVVMGGFDG